jgi:GLPGLI family protein
MKKHLLIAFASCLYILGFTGCSSSDEKFISEGSIEYDAAVVDQSNPMASLAPNKMTIKFKDNKSCAEMSAGMGLFSTSFISDPETKSMIQLVKLLNKKFSLVQNESEIKKENALYPVEVKETKETKIIAGYKCKKAHVKVNDEFGTEFDIYYTKDLNIKNPNFANPFSMIDGVLMEYQMKKFGLEMKFIAKTVKCEDVDDTTFELPADYKAISKAEMDELFLGLQ